MSARSLADIVKSAFPSGAHIGPHQPSYMTDPVAWVRDKQPKIETKTQGIVTFEPYEYQEQCMRYFAKGGTYFIRKSRQMGWTTLMLSGALSWAMMHYIDAKGRPLHFHLIADNAPKAVALLRKVKIALTTAKLSSSERRWLRGCDPEAGNDKVEFNPRGTSGGEIIGFNSIWAHATTSQAMRGHDGNGYMLDEAAEITDLELIFKAAHSMVTDVMSPPEFVISTPGSASHFFTELCENPSAWDAHYIPYESRGLVPGRDAAWEEHERKRMGDKWYEEEQGLRVAGEGEPIFDKEAMARHSRGVAPLPPTPIPGHKYSNAVDNSGPGQDAAAWVTTDLTARPAMPVYEEKLPKGAAEKEKRVVKLYEEWGGLLRVDGTNDATFVAYLKETFKKLGLNPNVIIPINFTGGKNYGENFDKVERLKWIYVPRDRIVRGAKGVMDSGRAVCLKECTPLLHKAIQTAPNPGVTARGNIESPASAKRRGKDPDILDAFMMTILPIMPRHATGEKREGPAVQRLGNVRDQRPGPKKW